MPASRVHVGVVAVVVSGEYAGGRVTQGRNRVHLLYTGVARCVRRGGLNK